MPSRNRHSRSCYLFPHIHHPIIFIFIQVSEVLTHAMIKVASGVCLAMKRVGRIEPGIIDHHASNALDYCLSKLLLWWHFSTPHMYSRAEWKKASSGKLPQQMAPL